MINVYKISVSLPTTGAFLLVLVLSRLRTWNSGYCHFSSTLWQKRRPKTCSSGWVGRCIQFPRTLLSESYCTGAVRAPPPFSNLPPQGKSRKASHTWQKKKKKQRLLALSTSWGRWLEQPTTLSWTAWTRVSNLRNLIPKSWMTASNVAEQNFPSSFFLNLSLSIHLQRKIKT